MLDSYMNFESLAQEVRFLLLRLLLLNLLTIDYHLFVVV